MTTTPQKLGFIGLGIMGAPMAGHLAKAGHHLFVDDAQHRAAEIVDAGATVLPDAKSVAAQADVVFVMVPDTPDVEKVLFGANGVAAGPVEGQDRRRHELDLADRDQGVRAAHRRARLRLPRRAGVGRRGRREGGVADHHGRRHAKPPSSASSRCSS